MRTTTWKDPNTHITYNKDDVIYITGTVYAQQNNDESVHTKEKVHNKAFYFRCYDDTYTHKVGITNKTYFDQPWWIDASAIVSGGTKESFTIIYNANGGSGGPGNQTKYWGEGIYLSKAVPTRLGYTFTGWSNTPEGTALWNPGSWYTGNSAATLYARWEIEKYTVRYELDGGKGKFPDQTKIYGQDLKIHNSIPTKEGHSFKGWYTIIDGNSYEIVDTYKFDYPSVIYAEWELNKYTISYIINDEASSKKDVRKMEVTHGEECKILSNWYKKRGHDFVEWNTEKNGSGDNYIPGTMHKFTSNKDL